MESEQNRQKNLSLPFGAFRCKIAIKGECSAPLWSFNFLSKLMRAANCVVLSEPFFVMRHMHNKMILIKQYTIFSSQQLGLKV